MDHWKFNEFHCLTFQMADDFLEIKNKNRRLTWFFLEPEEPPPFYQLLGRQKFSRWRHRKPIQAV